MLSGMGAESSCRKPLGVWMEGCAFGYGGRVQPPEAIGSLGAKPPALKIFAIFCNNDLFSGLVW